MEMRQALAENRPGVSRGPTLAPLAHAAKAAHDCAWFFRIFLNLIAKPMRQFGSQRTGYAETQLVIDLLNRMRQQDVASKSDGGVPTVL